MTATLTPYDHERADDRDDVGRDGDEVANQRPDLAIRLAPAHRPEHEHAYQPPDQVEDDEDRDRADSRFCTSGPTRPL